MDEKICLNCESPLTNRSKKFCSTKCQIDYQNNKLIDSWLEGRHDGRRGKTSTARWIKTFLINLFGNKCMECGWGETNEHTNNIPIELEHIDGDFTNNDITNLELLCPNCHSLTKTYKGANKGNGRTKKKLQIVLK
jgi:hypothetical protein